MSINSTELRVERVTISSLKAWPNHARKHDAGKLEALIKSIQQHELVDPVVVDENSTILSGHMRVAAFAALAWEEIPAIRISHLSAAQKSAYVIAANRFPERGGWDREILKLEFEALVDVELDLDLATTGFETPEIDLILQHEPTGDEEAPIPEPPIDPITQVGDLWLLGEHRLLCGDSLDPISWQRLMGHEKARVCFSDPPYNVRIKGHVTSGDHEEFAMASGEMSSSEFVEFLQCAFRNAVAHSVDGALHYLCMDHRHIRELYSACDTQYTEQINLCVWAKSNGGMGSFYRSQHELVAVFKVGTAPHRNNIQLGRFGRNRSNVWSYAGANSFGRLRDSGLADHPTPKPVAMVADALLDASNPNDICIDGFGGSGTLILAAEQTQRRARVIEIDPGYCDISVRRWEEMSGKTAKLNKAENGRSDITQAKPLLLTAPNQEANS